MVESQVNNVIFNGFAQSSSRLDGLGPGLHDIIWGKKSCGDTRSSLTSRGCGSKPGYLGALVDLTGRSIKLHGGSVCQVLTHPHVGWVENTPCHTEEMCIKQLYLFLR